jgi:hypothetical protein
MTDKTNAATRRTILLGAATLAAAPLVAGQAQAAGAMAQKAVQYVPKSKIANHCGICNFFIPGPTPTANGQCKAVAGVINPAGYCVLFAAKH